jgi:succinyl-CoA synthetase beta subunit
MNIHEHQAKTLLAGFGVPVPRGKPAFSVAEAVDAATELGGPVHVVKAQIHAGGRGKAGGVKVVASVDEVREVADDLLGKTLVTHQTGPQGREVKRLYVEEGCDIGDELYLSCLWIVAAAGSPSSPPARAAWISRRSPPPSPTRSCPSPSTRQPACSRITRAALPGSWG